MLQVALTPAAVAHDRVGEGRRALLVAAAETHGHADLPAGPAHQGRLDEVVAQDMAAERPLAGEVRQAGGAGEGGDADDGVVAPVIALGARPPGDAVGDQRAVEAAGELFGAGEKAVAVDDHRHGLQDAEARVALHGPGQTRQGVALHQAIGVEDDHEVVGGAERAHPFGDVAGLAVDVLRAVAIEDAGSLRQAPAQGAVALDLRPLDVFAGGVAENEDIEGVGGAGGVDRAPDGQESGGQVVGNLVVDRREEGGAGGQGRRRPVEVEFVTVAPRGPHPGKGASEGKRRPGEEGREDTEEHEVEQAEGVDGQDVVEGADRVACGDERRQDEEAGAPAEPPADAEAGPARTTSAGMASGAAVGRSALQGGVRNKVATSATAGPQTTNAPCRPHPGAPSGGELCPGSRSALLSRCRNDVSRRLGRPMSR